MFMRAGFHQAHPMLLAALDGKITVWDVFIPSKSMQNGFRYTTVHTLLAVGALRNFHILAMLGHPQLCTGPGSGLQFSKWQQAHSLQWVMFQETPVSFSASWAQPDAVAQLEESTEKSSRGNKNAYRVVDLCCFSS